MTRALTGSSSWRRLAVLSLCLLIPAAEPAGAEEESRETIESEPMAPDPATRQEGGSEHPVRDALREHGWHLAAIFGVELLTYEYHTTYGASSDPLFFSTPGDLDTRLREELSGSRSANYIWDNGLEAMKYGAPLALVAMSIGDGGQMSRDLIGFVGAFYTKRSVTRFLKDVIGRERPRLEFAEEDGLGPARIEELDKRSGNHRSFPSGHASGTFTIAAYMDRVIGREVGLDSAWRKVSFASLYGLAGWISYARLRTDRHYLTDLVAGAAIGVFVARRFYRHTHPEEFSGGRASHAHLPRRVTFHPPSIVPGGGVALTVGIRLGAPAR